ncbi:MAG: GntR family transcriptional regulator [Armatimonadota bacterium]|nr:GntR family transcriptional regulator [Armatimonadota bacterium]MDR7545416.1 GntR family transcriptional regulator [Armatimonadota bacterium]
MTLLADRIFEDLKRRILRFELRPGDRLLEEELAQQWRVSRTPVREACKRLVEAGLVHTAPRRGYTVRQLDLVEIDQCYEVRVALEVFAVGLAVERGRAYDWAALARIWSDPPDPLPDAEAMLGLDENFHLAIAEAAGNRVLVDYLRSISDRIRAVRAKDFTMLPRVRATYAQHAYILQRIAQGDAEAASEAMRDHILESKANVIPAVKELLAEMYLRPRV